jgi:hypothetical protein
VGVEVADVEQSEHDQDTPWPRRTTSGEHRVGPARTPITVDEAIAVAEQAIERYPQIEVIWIIGRETEQGLLDITVER